MRMRSICFVALALFQVMALAQTSVTQNPSVTESSPYKFKHYSETYYLEKDKALGTLLRFRIEKKLDFISKVPVIAYTGVLLDRSIAANSSSPHFGLKSEILPDLWTFAEYRRKYVEGTSETPGRNFNDARIGIAFEREYAPLYSNWLIAETMIEFVQIQRLSMDLYMDGWARLSPRYFLNQETFIEPYGEYNFVSFPTAAIETRNQLRAGVRGGLRLKNLSLSMLIYQPYQETSPARYQVLEPEMMTYLSAAL